MMNKVLSTFKGEVLPRLIQKQFSKKDLKEQLRPQGDSFDTLKWDPVRNLNVTLKKIDILFNLSIPLRIIDRCQAIVSKCFALRVNTLQAYRLANIEVQNIFKELYRPGVNVSKEERQPWPRDKVNKNVLGARVTIGAGCRVNYSRWFVADQSMCKRLYLMWALPEANFS